MRNVRISEAKNKLSELIDQASRGTEIIITRRGKPVAKLIPTDAGFGREKARRAVEGIVRLSKGLSLRGLKIKDLINQGRD